MRKDELLKIAKRLDFYISPNITKDKIASLAAGMSEEPRERLICERTPHVIFHDRPDLPYYFTIVDGIVINYRGSNPKD